MSVASLSGILKGGAHVAPRANEPIFDSVHISVKLKVPPLIPPPV